MARPSYLPFLEGKSLSWYKADKQELTLGASVKYFFLFKRRARWRKYGDLIEAEIDSFSNSEWKARRMCTIGSPPR